MQLLKCRDTFVGWEAGIPALVEELGEKVNDCHVCQGWHLLPILYPDFIWSTHILPRLYLTQTFNPKISLEFPGKRGHIEGTYRPAQMGLGDVKKYVFQISDRFFPISQFTQFPFNSLSFKRPHSRRPSGDTSNWRPHLLGFPISPPAFLGYTVCGSPPLFS